MVELNETNEPISWAPVSEGLCWGSVRGGNRAIKPFPVATLRTTGRPWSGEQKPDDNTTGDEGVRLSLIQINEPIENQWLLWRSRESGGVKRINVRERGSKNASGNVCQSHFNISFNCEFVGICCFKNIYLRVIIVVIMVMFKQLLIMWCNHLFNI